MSRWPFLRSLCPGQIRADDVEDIKEEIELYLELRTEELVKEGMDAGRPAVSPRAVSVTRTRSRRT